MEAEALSRSRQREEGCKRRWYRAFLPEETTSFRRALPQNKSLSVRRTEFFYLNERVALTSGGLLTARSPTTMSMFFYANPRAGLSSRAFIRERSMQAEI